MVEIKPAGFRDYEQLNTRKNISLHFINSNNYDRQYKVVYADEIFLNYKQQRKLTVER